MKRYRTRDEVIKALKEASKGDARREILSNPFNRSLVLSSGSNVTLYSGKNKRSNNVKDQLSSIYLGLIERLNAISGKPEGFGALGGLSERTDPKEFAKMSIDQQEGLFGLKDDVIRDNLNLPALTNDLNIIRVNTVQRETFEELGNLGIYDFSLDPKKLVLVDMPNVKDDNYIINIWNGGGQSWAITPFSHKYEVPESTLDLLVERSEEKKREDHSEVEGFRKMPLIDALARWGKTSGQILSEDGRDMQYDYRYPHEWLVSWRVAADQLKQDDSKMLNLITEVQGGVDHLISFASAAKILGKDLNFVADVLKIKPETMKKMEQNAQIVHSNNKGPISKARTQ